MRRNYYLTAALLPMRSRYTCIVKELNISSLVYSGWPDDKVIPRLRERESPGAGAVPEAVPPLIAPTPFLQ